MNERIINISSLSPLDIYGVNDKNINLIKTYFPNYSQGRGDQSNRKHQRTG